MRRLAVLGVCAWLAGCGTIIQPKGLDGVAIYGGLRWDVKVAGAQLDRGKRETLGQAIRRRVVIYPLLLLDLPFCAVIDTLLLPYSLLNELWLADKGDVRVETPQPLRAPGPFQGNVTPTSGAPRPRAAPARIAEDPGY